MSFYDEPPQPVGVVVERGRGSLPFALLHGEPLVACAAWAMGEAGILLLDLGTPWDDVRESGAPLVWHDVLCPMTPPEFLAACVRRSVAEDAVVVGVLPVTDTVKDLVERDGVTLVGQTHDRERLRRIASPIVLPPSVVAELDDWPDAGWPDGDGPDGDGPDGDGPDGDGPDGDGPDGDPVRLVDRLRRRGPLLFEPAPVTAARVSSLADLAGLEALTAR